MHWLPWSADAFALAARERKPILLSISASWCAACHEMDRTTYSDPTVCGLAAADYVAIRVDTDQRPDINDRYNLGGWPTTAFLTPEGALIGGGTYLDADRMAGVLRQVSEAFPTIAPIAPLPDHDETFDSDDHGKERVSPPDPWQVFASFDEEHGGFGTEPKFPFTSPLLLAIALHREGGDPRHRVIVERTLDAIAEGGLWDRESGGYYRYATTRDWQLPHREKLLDTNAALLTVFVESAAVFQRDADRDRAERLAAFIVSLASSAGGYAGSATDTRVFAASTGHAAAALLAAARLMDDRELAQSVLRQFESFLLSAYRPGRGVAHSVENGVLSAGLLADQISTGTALLAAFATTGDEPYRMMAEELGLHAVAEFGAKTGGFFDRVPHPSDVGLLRERRQPYAGNCDAAVFFARLRQASRDEAFEAVPERALDCAAPAAAVHGPDAARWLLAAREVAIR